VYKTLVCYEYSKPFKLFYQSMTGILFFFLPVTPSEPRNVSVDSVGGTWAVISWLMPELIGRPPSTEYRITDNILLNANVSTAVQNDTDTVTVNVTVLLPATEYQFTVAAVSVVQATEIFRAESAQSVAALGTTLLTGLWILSHSHSLYVLHRIHVPAWRMYAIGM